MNLRQKLDLIFDETTTKVHDRSRKPWATRRYIAKSNGTPGYGWQVYDRKLSRFLTDAEVKRIKDPREEFIT